MPVAGAAGPVPCTYPSSWPRPVEAGGTGAPAQLRFPGASQVRSTRCRDNVQRHQLVASSEGTIEIAHALRDGERIVGFGEQFVALDQRGRTVTGWIEDILNSHPRVAYYLAPLWISSAGYAVVVNTYLPFVADVGESDAATLRFRVDAPSLECFVITGTPAEIAMRVRELTGAAQPPPDWLFGVWACCASGTDKVLAGAARIRAEGLPCSAVWVYDQYDPVTNSGCGSGGTYPRGAYPDFAALVAELHHLGFRALTYLNPAVYAGTPHHEEASRRDLLVRRGDGVFTFDFFHPEHQEPGVLIFEPDIASLIDFTTEGAPMYWRENLRQLVVEQGWDGWMQDFGEQVGADAFFADGSKGSESHNRYASLYHAATDGALRELGVDAVTFVRAGWLGDHTTTTMVWPGDQSCDWSVERGIGSLIPAGISAGSAGVVCWGPDISGIVEFGPDDALGRSKELWIRWLELGALCPVMKTHLGFKRRAGTPVDMWTDEETVAAFREMSTLHMRLLPYFVRLASDGVATGAPIMRGCFFEFPHDPNCWSLDDQYMLGPAVLVAPVLHEGATTRRLYLPEGAWTELWTGRTWAGARWIDVDAPLLRPPVFLRDSHDVELLAADEIPQTVAGLVAPAVMR